MNELEDRLRAALDARAQTYEIGAHAWGEVRDRLPRSSYHRFWPLALIPVAAAAVAVPLFLTAENGKGGGVTTGVVSTAPAGEEPAGEGQEDIYEGIMQDKTPLGDRLVLDNPSEHRPMVLWFAKPENAKDDTGPMFCEALQGRTGPGGAMCGDPLGKRKQAWVTGSTVAWPLPETVLYYGATRDGVSGVSTVGKDGIRVAGKIQRPEGAPLSLWTVSAPSKTQVAAFEFTDAAGRVVERVRNDYHYQPMATGAPVGTAMTMPEGMVASVYPFSGTKTLIWTLNGQEVGQNGVDAKNLTADAAGGRYPVDFLDRDGHWFGVTDARTARIALVFKDGTSKIAETRADSWGFGIRLFAGTYRRSGDIYLEGFQLVGYDETGTEIWRKDNPAQQLQWQTSQPTSSPG